MNCTLKYRQYLVVRGWKVGSTRYIREYLGGGSDILGTVLSFQREMGRKVGMCTACALA